MEKRSEQQALEVLRSFYKRYEGAELKTRTQINNQMERLYPNWQSDSNLRAIIRNKVLGRLPIDEFDEYQKRVFDEAFHGWTVAQMTEFAKKYENILKDMYKKVRWDERDAEEPFVWYVNEKREEKMRAASEFLERQFGDSLGFTRFDRDVKLYGGERVPYNELQMRWAAEQEKFGRK